ncbi:MAG: hypothetical protein O3B87_05205 [bacterium]|nr:hypothetical protein [bacterium]
MSFIRKHYKVLSLLLLGIGIRLIYLLLFTQMLDFVNILAVVRSVAETGSMVGGFNALLRVGFESQLYGKIYYQTIGLWLTILDSIGLLHIEYLLDTKEFTDYSTYLNGLWLWSPPLYQLTLIKLVQFLWDGFFVAALYIAARHVNKAQAHLAVLFWAVNPYFIMINFAFFMPDIFMLALFVGGFIFWVKALKSNKEINTNTLFALALFTLGAVVKQVPLLAIPPLLISTNRSWRSLIIYIGSTVIMYILFKQSWSEDSHIINSNFLFSKESMALLANHFNGIPYFMYMYGFFMLFLLKCKEQIFQNSTNILLVILSIITIVYINDPIFFIQFVIWILPFVFLLALSNKNYHWVFLFGIIAMLLKGWTNESYLSLILSPTIGSLYNNVIDNKFFIDSLFNFQIYDLMLRFGVLFLFATILAESLSLLFRNKYLFSEIFERYIRGITIKKIVILYASIYVIFIVVDYSIKSKYVLIPQQKYQLSETQIPISTKPIIIHVNNTNNRIISGMRMSVMQSGRIQEGVTIFEFRENNNVIKTIKVNDHLFPKSTDDPFILIIPQKIKSNKFDIHIYKEDEVNKIVFFESIQLKQINFDEMSIFGGYERPDERDLLQVNFENVVFPIYFHGTYSYSDIGRAFAFHANSTLKKGFFSGYILSAVIIIFLSFSVYKYGRKQQK